MRRRLIERRSRPQEAPGEALVEAARERLVEAALSLRPGQRRSLARVRFKVRCAELLLRLAQTA